MGCAKGNLAPPLNKERRKVVNAKQLLFFLLLASFCFLS